MKFPFGIDKSPAIVNHVNEIHYPYSNNENDEKSEKKGTGSLKEKIQEQLIKKRQIFLWGAVMDKSAELIVEKLLFLENTDPGKPIHFFINSPGGVITSGMAIYDVMKMISSPVHTITMGSAASMGAILLCAGEKGHRYVFPHARVMIHQPLISGQIVAPALDIKIHADEIKKTRAELNSILAEATGHSIEKIEKDTDRDYNLNGKEAVDYGIADAVLTDFSQLQQSAVTKKPTQKTSPKRSAPKTKKKSSK